MSGELSLLENISGRKTERSHEFINSGLIPWLILNLKSEGQMNRVVTRALAALTIALSIWSTVAAAASPSPAGIASPSPAPFEPPPPVGSRTAVLIDAVTGQVLFDKAAHQRMFPASTTKILTAIIALEKGNLAGTVTVSEKAWGQEGSSAYLEVGEKQTLENMLYALILPSGNDAATAIAEHIAGSEEKFADLMNQKAREIGAKDSNFVTPHGLHNPNHYTTAYDLAIIAQYAMKNPVFARIAGTQKFTLPGGAKPREFYNHNKLLWRYDGATGVKTGFTDEAGYTLVASSSRNGRSLIAVLMDGDKSGMYDDAARLLDYGFTAFTSRDLIASNAVVTSLPVNGGKEERAQILAEKGLTLTLSPQAAAGVQSKVVLPKSLEAPVEAGVPVGELQFLSGDKLLGKVSLVTASAVPRRTIPLDLSWWWAFPVGAYAIWRTRVAIRRRRRGHRRRRYSSHSDSLPLHRMYGRGYGD